MGQNSSNIRSATHEISRLLWNPKVITLFKRALHFFFSRDESIRGPYTFLKRYYSHLRLDYPRNPLLSGFTADVCPTLISVKRARWTLITFRQRFKASSYQLCPPRNSIGRQSYVHKARCQLYFLFAVTF
jgi:hypothetical protein